LLVATIESTSSDVAKRSRASGRVKTAESEILWKGFEDFFLGEGWETDSGELVILTEVGLFFTMGENNRVVEEFFGWSPKILLDLGVGEEFATVFWVLVLFSLLWRATMMGLELTICCTGVQHREPIPLVTDEVQTTGLPEYSTW
jgi:hypothetical protein